MCRDGPLPSVPPSSLSRMHDKGTACGCRIVTSGRCAARPAVLPCAVAFASCLPFSRLTGQLQVSVATWTAQLSTKAAGHPLSVSACARGRSVRRSDRVPEGGRAGTGGTSEPDLPEGETRERRRTVRHRLTGVLLVTRDKGGARCSPCDVDAGSSQRSKVVASASVHQSRERRLGRGTPQ